MYIELTSLVIFLLMLYILNLFWLSIYCRIEAKIDFQIRLKEKIDSGTQTTVYSNPRKETIYLLKRVYRWLEHYLYGWMRYSILQVGRIPSNRIRKLLYKYVFAMKLSKGTVISAGCEIRSPWNIRLGKCTIAGNCILDGRSGIIIEDNVVLGMGVHIWTQEHDVNSPSFAVNAEHKGTVIIRKHAWVCSDSTVLPKMEIGEGAVVAAKACVTKNCEAFGIYGGVPAKRIGDRTHELTYELSGKPHWHFN